MNVRAAPRITDQILEPVHRDALDHLCLGQPPEWIGNIEALADRLRSRRRICASTWGWVARVARAPTTWARGGRFRLTMPFSKNVMRLTPNSLAVTAPSAAKRKDRVRCVELRSCLQRDWPRPECERPGLLRGRIWRSTDEMLLRLDDLGRRTVADEGDELIVRDELVDRSREGV